MLRLITDGSTYTHKFERMKESLAVDKSRSELYKEIIEKKRRQLESSPFYKRMQTDVSIARSKTPDILAGSPG